MGQNKSHLLKRRRKSEKENVERLDDDALGHAVHFFLQFLYKPPFEKKKRSENMIFRRKLFAGA
jgi:hypothetical protein